MEAEAVCPCFMLQHNKPGFYFYIIIYVKKEGRKEGTTFRFSRYDGVR